MSPFSFDNTAQYVTATAVFGIGLTFVVLFQRSPSTVSRLSTTTIGWLKQRFGKFSTCASVMYIPSRSAPSTEIVRPEQNVNASSDGLLGLMAEVAATRAILSRHKAKEKESDREFAKIRENIFEMKEDLVENRRDIAMNRVAMSIQGKRISMTEDDVRVLHKRANGLEEKVEKLEKKDEEQDVCFYIICASIVAILCCVAKYDIF